MADLRLAQPGDVPPASRTYWVVRGSLLAGAYPLTHHAEIPDKLDRLLAAGMRTFVNLTVPGEGPEGLAPLAPYEDLVRERGRALGVDVVCHRFPIVDQNIPTREAMRATLAAIDASLSSGVPVYVHCHGGMGRTGTVVSCWLLTHGFATSKSILDLLSQLRRADSERGQYRIPDVRIQCDFIVNW